MSFLSRDFLSCVLEPIEDCEFSSITCCNGKWKAYSFFLDSSGRSVVSLPLLLRFSSGEVLDRFLRSNCISPLPDNLVFEEEEDIDGGLPESADEDDEETPKQSQRELQLFARVALTSGNGQAITSKVEDVRILSTKIEEDKSSLSMQTEVAIRVSLSKATITTDDDQTTNNHHHQTQLGDVKASMNIGASFAEFYSTAELDRGSSALKLLDALNHQSDSLLNATPKPVVTSLAAIPIQVTLTQALEIAVRSVPGPIMGHTFLSLSMRHTNTHEKPVTITSIALHPGVSWYSRPAEPTASPRKYINSNNNSTIVVTEDMSSVVQWGYAPGCAPDLPLTLQPHQATAVCLTIDASQDTMSRLCACPVFITADVVLGREERHEIVATSQARWQTARTAVEPADAFRVDLRLEANDERLVVGSPVTIALQIANMHSEVKQLMLLVDQPLGSGKWSIVAEKGGQKFGLVGGEEDRAGLMVVDNALILGEVKGHGSKDAHIRIIPLEEGTIDIPNFKLIDSRTGKRYACIHKLQALVEAPSQ